LSLRTLPVYVPCVLRKADPNTKVMHLPVQVCISVSAPRVPKGFMRIRHYGLLANCHRTEHLGTCRAALDAPLLRRLPNPKPSSPSSLGCSGPMPTAARTVAKDGCARSEPSPLLGPPAHPFCDGRPEPLRFHAPATSSDRAAARLAPTSPIDPFPPVDHTSSRAQARGPSAEIGP
jgi:hypothetical protein